METLATPNIGRKISGIRELRGVKQEPFSYKFGISQQSISKMSRVR